MRWLTVQYQATSTTTAHRANRAMIAPAKITMIWPRSREVRPRGRVGRIGAAVSRTSMSVMVSSARRVEGHDGAVRQRELRPPATAEELHDARERGHGVIPVDDGDTDRVGRRRLVAPR